MIISYLPDIEFYRRYAGFIIDVENPIIPGKKCKTIGELIYALKHAFEEKIDTTKICRVLYSKIDGKDAERVVDFLLNLMAIDLKEKSNESCNLNCRSR